MMRSSRRGTVIERRNDRPNLFGALLAWFRRDFVLRRLSLVVGGLCVLFIFGYVLFHTLLMAPVFLLAVLCFWYGASGRRRNPS